MMLLALWSVSVLPGELIHMNASLSAFPSPAAATSISSYSFYCVAAAIKTPQHESCVLFLPFQHEPI